MTLTAHGPTEVDHEAITARQDRRESSARSYARHLRMVPVEAAGMTVTGADGRRYLDCLSGAGTLALGHNHPVVVEAVRRVIDRGSPWHTLDIATPEKDEFTDALFATLPSALAERGRILFCGPAGTDAVEAALKLARTLQTIDRLGPHAGLVGFQLRNTDGTRQGSADRKSVV